MNLVILHSNDKIISGLWLDDRRFGVRDIQGERPAFVLVKQWIHCLMLLGEMHA